MLGHLPQIETLNCPTVGPPNVRLACGSTIHPSIPLRFKHLHGGATEQILKTHFM